MKARMTLLVLAVLLGAAAQAEEAPGTSGSLERDGLHIEFQARPVSGQRLQEGGFADLSFRIRDLASGQPLGAANPGAWLDHSLQHGEMSCKARVGMYLKSSLGARPLVDLNSYFLLLMNRDASLTVIDPNVSLAGVTSTLARIGLKRPPMDWTASADGKRIYVSMPEAGQVALIDAERFQVLGNLDAGVRPVRVALQPDGRYLWVGNNAEKADESGVSVIDTQTRKLVAHLPSGLGHHEIAFDRASRFAFVSNRDSGTLSIYDIAGLKLLETLKTGPQPLAVAYSALSEAVYVTDGETGNISVIDARSHTLRSVLTVGRGLGPMRFSDDGRYGIALNTLDDRVLIVDAGSDKLVHDLAVPGEPFQVTFSRQYAYIRGLSTPRVTMLNLSSLSAGRVPIVQGFEAGPAAPRQAGDLPLAESLGIGRDSQSVFVVNPVDNSTYFYAEGMNAPMSAYPNRGHAARAVRVIDRSLREVEPGLYSARVRLPAAGKFDVAFMLNQPQLIHCFSAEVAVDPQLEARYGGPKVEFLVQRTPLPGTGEAKARFRIVDGRSGAPRKGIGDLRVRYFLAPSSLPREVSVREVGEGVYEACLYLDQPGAWYLHVRSPSLGLGGSEGSASLRVLPPRALTSR
ncbi:YVTN family beta-propeller repeat protein [Pseudomonas knackmussii B13]|uniref:YVTN family beta-propeller repeat protein n=1 Tax=Pseudomonas knackmussii (strain DSM 6978 / CCUG 54928 / LMG 23759 / B13) TaxID=1301098 RepID=A0A024HFL4_PSEKB|nr:YncE family protein [Pseudomonas knackmussii]CDF83419.1 YVTN family beta-propeller repeat protein [Pseudomonas knackmussii B13]